MHLSFFPLNSFPLAFPLGHTLTFSLPLMWFKQCSSIFCNPCLSLCFGALSFNFFDVFYFIRHCKYIICEYSTMRENLCIYSFLSWTVARQAPRNSPHKNTGVSCLSLFQGIFLTQGLNKVSSITGGFLTVWATREIHSFLYLVPKLRANH